MANNISCTFPVKTQIPIKNSETDCKIEPKIENNEENIKSEIVSVSCQPKTEEFALKDPLELDTTCAYESAHKSNLKEHISKVHETRSQPTSLCVTYVAQHVLADQHLKYMWKQFMKESSHSSVTFVDLHLQTNQT